MTYQELVNQTIFSTESQQIINEAVEQHKETLRLRVLSKAIDKVTMSLFFVIRDNDFGDLKNKRGERIEALDPHTTAMHIMEDEGFSLSALRVDEQLD